MQSISAATESKTAQEIPSSASEAQPLLSFPKCYFLVPFVFDEDSLEESPSGEVFIAADDEEEVSPEKLDNRNGFGLLNRMTEHLQPNVHTEGRTFGAELYGTFLDLGLFARPEFEESERDGIAIGDMGFVIPVEQVCDRSKPSSSDSVKSAYAVVDTLTNVTAEGKRRSVECGLSGLQTLRESQIDPLKPISDHKFIRIMQWNTTRQLIRVDVGLKQVRWHQNCGIFYQSDPDVEETMVDHGMLKAILKARGFDYVLNKLNPSKPFSTPVYAHDGWELKLVSPEQLKEAKETVAAATEGLSLTKDLGESGYLLCLIDLLEKEFQVDKLTPEDKDVIKNKQVELRKFCEKYLSSEVCQGFDKLLIEMRARPRVRARLRHGAVDTSAEGNLAAGAPVDREAVAESMGNASGTASLEAGTESVTNVLSRVAISGSTNTSGVGSTTSGLLPQVSTPGADCFATEQDAAQALQNQKTGSMSF